MERQSNRLCPLKNRPDPHTDYDNGFEGETDNRLCLTICRAIYKIAQWTLYKIVLQICKANLNHALFLNQLISAPENRSSAPKIIHPYRKMVRRHGKTAHPHGRIVYPHQKMAHPHGKTAHPHGKMAHPHRKMIYPPRKTVHPHGKIVYPH